MKNVRISELQNRADFNDIMKEGLSPILLEGYTEEPSVYEEIYKFFEMTRNSVEFPSLKGLVVGKITEGEEIPFIYLGTGTQTIKASDYGVRIGFTRQMIRDDELDVMKYVTSEIGKGHKRTKNMVALKALEAGAANSAASTTGGKLLLADIQTGKKTARKFTEDGTGIPRPVYFTHLLIHPDQELDLIPATMDALPPGIVIDKDSGELKGAAGLKVVQSAWVTPGVALLVRAKDKVLECEREKLTFENAEVFATAAEQVRSLEAYTFAILDGDHVYKITNC